MKCISKKFGGKYMCGIVCYNGEKSAVEIILNGLKSLEYRGYDSSGISVVTDKIETVKRKGKFLLPLIF